MQKLINRLIIFIAFIFIASSCNNSRGISVTKRHYSKGNYVSVNKKQKPFVYHNPTKKISPVVITQPEIVAISKESTKEEKGIEANVDAKLNSNELQSPDRLNDMINTAESNKVKETERASNLKSLTNIKKGNNLFHISKIQPNGEARSLFWLVITILLIIWLIALVSGGWGLGGLVNILLVVALILFILWLLRLI